MSNCILVDSKDYEELKEKAAQEKKIQVIIRYEIGIRSGCWREVVVKTSEGFDLEAGLFCKIKSLGYKFLKDPENHREIEEFLSKKRKDEFTEKCIQDYLKLGFWERIRIAFKSNSGFMKYKSWKELIK